MAPCVQWFDVPCSSNRDRRKAATKKDRSWNRLAPKRARASQQAARTGVRAGRTGDFPCWVEREYHALSACIVGRGVQGGCTKCRGNVVALTIIIIINSNLQKRSNRFTVVRAKVECRSQRGQPHCGPRGDSLRERSRAVIEAERRLIQSIEQRLIDYYNAVENSFLRVDGSRGVLPSSPAVAKKRDGSRWRTATKSRSIAELDAGLRAEIARRKFEDSPNLDALIEFYKGDPSRNCLEVIIALFASDEFQGKPSDAKPRNGVKSLRAPIRRLSSELSRIGL